MGIKKSELKIPSDPTLNNDEIEEVSRLTGCTCPYCGKSWYMENTEPMPSEETVLTCMRCEFEWKSRIDSPLKCPKCGSYAWNKPINKCICKMCGHDWISRMDDTPSKCPMCKSKRWNLGPIETGEEFNIEDPEITSARERWVCKKYSEGFGCVRIAAQTGMPFTRVVDIIRAHTGNKSVRP